MDWFEEPGDFPLARVDEASSGSPPKLSPRKAHNTVWHSPNIIKASSCFYVALDIEMGGPLIDKHPLMSIGLAVGAWRNDLPREQSAFAATEDRAPFNCRLYRSCETSPHPDLVLMDKIRIPVEFDRDAIDPDTMRDFWGNEGRYPGIGGVLDTLEKEGHDLCPYTALDQSRLFPRLGSRALGKRDDKNSTSPRGLKHSLEALCLYLDALDALCLFDTEHALGSDPLTAARFSRCPIRVSQVLIVSDNPAIDIGRLDCLLSIHCSHPGLWFRMLPGTTLWKARMHDIGADDFAETWVPETQNPRNGYAVGPKTLLYSYRGGSSILDVTTFGGMLVMQKQRSVRCNKTHAKVSLHSALKILKLGKGVSLRQGVEHTHYPDDDSEFVLAAYGVFVLYMETLVQTFGGVHYSLPWHSNFSL